MTEFAYTVSLCECGHSASLHSNGIPKFCFVCKCHEYKFASSRSYTEKELQEVVEKPLEDEVIEEV